MKWPIWSIVIGLIFASFVNAQSITIGNDIILEDASQKMNLTFQSNPFGFNGTIGKTSIFIKPQLNTTLGLLEQSTATTTYTALRSGGYAIDGIRKKFSFNYSSIPTLLQNRLLSINLVISGNVDFKAAAHDDTTIYFDGFYIDFSDLLSSGFTFQIINTSYIRIIGVANTATIDLDPIIAVYSNGVKGVYDTYVFSGGANNNYGSSKTLIVGNETGANGHDRIYIAFNTSMIPTDAIVSSAQIQLWKTGGTVAQEIRMYRVMEYWGEGTLDGATPATNPCGATYQRSCYNTTYVGNWSGGYALQGNLKGSLEGIWGQDGTYNIYNFTAATRNTTATATYNLTYTGYNLTELVKSWINNSVYWRFGVVLVIEYTATTGSYVTIQSSESNTIHQRPVLIIDYTANSTVNGSAIGSTPSAPIEVRVNFRDSGNFSYSNENFGGRMTGFRKNSTLGGAGMLFRFGDFRIGTPEGEKADYLTTAASGSYVSTTAFANDSLYNTTTALIPFYRGGGCMSDVNGDGVDEVFTVADQGSGATSAAIALQYANGSIIWTTHAGTGTCFTCNTYDANNDGVKDFIVTCGTNATGRDFVRAYNGSIAKTQLWEYNTTWQNTIRLSTEGRAMTTAYMYNSRWETIVGVANTTNANLWEGWYVLNSSTGNLLYNSSRSLNRQYWRDFRPADCGKAGYNNCWAVLGGVGGVHTRSIMYLFNSTNATLWSSGNVPTELSSGGDFEVMDFDGDGYNNEIVYYSNSTIYIMKIGYVGTAIKPLHIMNISNPLFDYTFLGATGTFDSVLFAEDINQDGKKELIFQGKMGNVFIFGQNGTKLGEYYQNSQVGTGSTIFGTDHTFLDIGRNGTTNATLIGWTHGVGSTSHGWTVFEYEPCLIEFPTGSNRWKAMSWNQSTNSWYYYNSTGLSAGTYNATVHCNGNWTDQGKVTRNITFTISSGVTSIAFLVLTLGGSGAGNTTYSGEVAYGNETEALYFYSNGRSATMIQPCTANQIWSGSDTKCQNGITRPTYRLLNLGTVNINYYMKLSADPTYSSTSTVAKLCANSSVDSGGTPLANCDMSSTTGSLNGTAWLKLVTALPPNNYLNISLYFNLTDANVSETLSSSIYGNSTT